MKDDARVPVFLTLGPRVLGTDLKNLPLDVHAGACARVALDPRIEANKDPVLTAPTQTDHPLIDGYRGIAPAKTRALDAEVVAAAPLALTCNTPGKHLVLD